MNDISEDIVVRRVLEEWASTPSCLIALADNLTDACRVDTTRLKGPSHNSARIEPRHVSALITLARGLLLLEQNQAEFHMRTFRADLDPRQTPASPQTMASKQPPCGTVACAVGYAPYFLDVDPPEYKAEALQQTMAWIRFSGEHFGDLPDGLWGWCFETSWQEHDNGPHGAAARIAHMLLRAPALPFSIADLEPEDASEDYPWTLESDPSEPYQYLLERVW